MIGMQKGKIAISIRELPTSSTHTAKLIRFLSKFRAGLNRPVIFVLDFLSFFVHNSPTSLSMTISPSPGPALAILLTKSPMALMPSTCSSRKSSRKSVMLPSALLSARTWRSMIDWLTVFSNSKAFFIASKGVPHSSFSGLGMSFSTTRPPREFWNFMNFSACSASSAEAFLKYLEKPVNAIEVKRHRQINVVRVKFHVHLLVDARFAFLMVVLTNNGCHLDFL